MDGWQVSGEPGSSVVYTSNTVVVAVITNLEVEHTAATAHVPYFDPDFSLIILENAHTTFEPGDALVAIAAVLRASVAVLQVASAAGDVFVATSRWDWRRAGTGVAGRPAVCIEIKIQA